MAVPSITTISPASGPTGGQTYVEIVGTNFRLATAHTTHPAPTPSPPVKVQFRQVVVRHTPDGRAISQTVTRDATAVAVHSATLLSCLTPVGDHGESNAALTADVIVSNITDAGTIIAGETVTVAAGYSYSLPALTAESDFTRVIRTLLREFKRQVCEETVLTTETDWADDTTDGLQTTAEPKLPSLTLIGPRTDENTDQATALRRKTQSGIVFYDFRPATFLDLEFDLVGATGGPAAETQGLNFSVQIVEFFRRNPYLVVPADPADVSKGNVEFELDLTSKPSFDNGPNLSNVRSFRAVFVLKGVPVEGLAEVTDDLLYRKGAPIETFEIDSAREEVP